jgi:hypothetical protein
MAMKHLCSCLLQILTVMEQLILEKQEISG